MFQPRRFSPAILLIAVPLLAAVPLVYKMQSRQAALAKPVSPMLPDVPRSLYSSFHWSPSAAEELILKQKGKRLKTLPASVIAIGASYLAANTIYNLANQPDVNGFEYYQNHDKTQYCQWSTMNFCWCIRSSLVSDSPRVRLTAEYYSSRRQSYLAGPAGIYGYGGNCPPLRGSRPPIVTVLSADNHRAYLQ